MKRKIASLMLIIFLAVGIFSLFGCGTIYIGDEATAKKNMEKLINALKNKDRDAMKALFAPNKIAEIEDIDWSIDCLL